MSFSSNVNRQNPPRFGGSGCTVKPATFLPLPPNKRMPQRTAGGKNSTRQLPAYSAALISDTSSSKSTPSESTGMSALPSPAGADTGSASGGEEPRPAAAQPTPRASPNAPTSQQQQAAAHQSINAVLPTAHSGTAPAGATATTVQQQQQQQAHAMAVTHALQKRQQQQQQQQQQVRRRRVELQVPPASTCPYAGCRFILQHACAEQAAAPAAERWVWGSVVYHPVLSQGKALCSCVVKRAHAINPSNPTSATLQILAAMLERPLQTKYCPSCPIRREVLSEALLDYPYFSRKAR